MKRYFSGSSIKVQGVPGNRIFCATMILSTDISIKTVA